MPDQTAEPDFQDVHIAGIDLSQSQPPGRRILERSALEIVSSDHPLVGGVMIVLDREPPDGWQECFRAAELELGYRELFAGRLNGDTIEVDFDPERFEERFTGLKVAIANANLRYRQVLEERAESRRRAEQVAAEYRRGIAEVAQRLGIATVGE